MSGSATPEEPARRRYDSPVRRQRAAQTRERIVDAGSALVHGFPTWDWRELTFRAVAERAGVGERTVYRYFPTERDLHDAVMRRLEQEAGVAYDGLGLDDLAGVAARAFATLSSFAVTEWTGRDAQQPALVAEDRHRRDAVLAAVTPGAADWSERERRIAAAVLDVLWGMESYERLRTRWELDGEAATEGITWVIGLLVDAIRADRRPGPAG